MKDKENQVFDGYGNHDFPTEIKQDRLNNVNSQSEKIVYGSLITSTKCYNCIHFPLCFAQKGAANLELASENGCCYYQSKLPEDSVVLSREEYEKIAQSFSKELLLQTERTTKEVVEKFISEIEFHGIATMDGVGLEYFKISSLGLREIAREQFDVEVDK